MQSRGQMLPCPLLDLLRNTLIVNYLSPYLGISNLLSLAATSISFRNLVYCTPSVFRYTDLSHVPSCHLLPPSNTFTDGDGDREASMMMADDFYAQTLRRVFRSLQNCHVLQDVRTLILDGLPVPATLLREILCDGAYNIRILSLRGARELGDEKLIQILRYIIRPSRPEGTPKLKGLYYFTPLDASADYTASNLVHRVPGIGITNAVGAQLGAGTFASSGAMHKQFIRSSWHQNNVWYSATGQVLKVDATVQKQWALVIQACEGLIAFDVAPCRQSANHSKLDLGLATVSLAGCQMCGSCPEGPAYPSTSAENELPLLAPLPTHQSSVKIAQRLDTNGRPHPPFIARCRTCLKDRWCERCNVWWCESCYTIPSKRDRALLPQTSQATEPSIKVHNNLCVSKCLIDEMLNEVGEGGIGVDFKRVTPLEFRDMKGRRLIGEDSDWR